MATRPKGSRFTFTDATVSALATTAIGGEAATGSAHRCRLPGIVAGGGIGRRESVPLAVPVVRQVAVTRARRFGDFVDGADGRGVEKITVDWARYPVGLDQRDALEGRDPRERGKRTAAASMTFKDVVTQYLAVMQDQQRRPSWRRGMLNVVCAPLHWRAMGNISREHIQAILDLHKHVLRHPRMAEVILVRLKSLWKWALKRGYVKDMMVVQCCESTHIGKVRDRVYSATELAAIWKATGTLSDIERDSVRLLMLLVPRKTALARMERSHLNEDVTLWTTPFALTKSRATPRPGTICETS